ncbi:hypothetical protein CICLE_v10001437mg [Citrus x clementina]|uniref:Uncharacterized protein n=1 Tax=Citrus clementina TaxID=85681 RepID=V4SJ08_CITCL|nr:hypothetical protein CICLE_v10001437mg [Citrus x clementina]
MESRLSASLGLPSPDPNHYPLLSESTSLFTHLSTNLLSAQSHKPFKNDAKFASTSLSTESQTKFQPSNWLKPASRNSPKIHSLIKSLSVFERALIGAAAGGIAGAFTYVCLYPLDTIKTKLQTKGASKMYSSTFDAIFKTFQTKGILGFYSGVSAVLVGSTASSAIYFGTCEFGKSFLSKLEIYPSVLIPPTAGAMGNIVSSAIMVPKELITQRMQAVNKIAAVMYTGVTATVKQILKEEGWVGLTRGMAPRVVHSACFSAIGYFAFETARLTIMHQYLKKKELAEMDAAPA